MKNREPESYLSIPQVASLLGISRIAVYRKVKTGRIPAVKIGRNFAVPKTSLAPLLGTELDGPARRRLDRAVRKTVKEYGEVLAMLGRD